jgi:hypothetical protein
MKKALDQTLLDENIFRPNIVRPNVITQNVIRQNNIRRNIVRRNVVRQIDVEPYNYPCVQTTQQKWRTLMTLFCGVKRNIISMTGQLSRPFLNPGK